MDVVGGDPAASAHGLDELPGNVNYLVGNDPASWRTGISSYGQVAFTNVYPGIDLVYYGSQEHLEYDFVVRPGADARSIGLRLGGAEDAHVDAGGNLVLETGAGPVVQQKPLVYQDVDGARREVPGNFVLTHDAAAPGAFQVSFRVGEYDPSRPLVIDPIMLSYSTFLGGSGWDEAFAVAVDKADNIYVSGTTGSTNLPSSAGALETTYGGGSADAFVAKLKADGSGLDYLTYLGGSTYDDATGIAVDAAGRAYVSGYTGSSDFPTTPGAFQTHTDGGADAFISELKADGTGLVYSTLLGGTGNDVAWAVAVNAAGNAFVAGHTTSFNFPTTPPEKHAVHATLADAFVVELKPGGSGLVYSLRLGGGDADIAWAVAVDAAGCAYLAGHSHSSNFPTTPGAFQTTSGGFTDAFVAKIKADGSGLVYSTYLGGSQYDTARGIAVDAAGHAWVTGYTYSDEFPVTQGAFQTKYHGYGSDGFVAELSADGSNLLAGTLLGGSGEDSGRQLLIGPGGGVFVVGYTASSDYPTTSDAFQHTYGDGGDAFVTELKPNLTGLIYSTYLGGQSEDWGRAIALDGAGSVVVAGRTLSPNFPVRGKAFQATFGGDADAFVGMVLLNNVPGHGTGLPNRSA
jgi:hypothetical protein